MVEKSGEKISPMPSGAGFSEPSEGNSSTQKVPAGRGHVPFQEGNSFPS